MTKKYEDYTREQLLEEIKKLKKQKKFGLVWEDKPEQVVEDCKNNFPVLTEVSDKAISEAENSPTHLIIEGDNFHSLSVLNVTHKGKIDVIYIDPPYNTGNKDFKYNDHFVDKEDSFRHSKWLSFMEKRLKLAKELLSETGVIFISIDDNEQAHLKLLCDYIFGENNFVAQFLWEKTSTPPALSKKVRKKLEYVLCYENTFDNITYSIGKVDGGDVPLLNSGNKESVLKFPINSIKFNIPDGTYIENGVRKVKLLNEAIVKNSFNENEIEIKGNFKWKQSMLDNEISKGTYFIIKSDLFSIRFQRDENNLKTKTPTNIINKEINVGTNEEAKKELEILDIGYFDYPKPVTLIKLLTNLKYNKSATILDFFAGSGTTGHAVLELNKEDGGNRQFILCTNNENAICEEVTYPRIKTVITGERTDGTNYSDGIPANLRYFKTDFIEKSEDTDENRISLTKRCYELLQIKESCYESQKSNIESLKIWRSNNKLLAVIFDRYDNTDDQKYISEITGFAHNSDEVVVYRFSIDGNLDMDISALPNARLEEIPEEILKTFNQIFKTKKKRK